MVERLFLVVPWGCLQFVIVVFPDHTHLFFDVLVRFWVANCFWIVLLEHRVWSISSIIFGI